LVNPPADPQGSTAPALVHHAPPPGHLLPPPAARAGSAELPLATFCCGRPCLFFCFEELKYIEPFSSYSEYRTLWGLARTPDHRLHIFGTAMLCCEPNVKRRLLRRTVSSYSVKDRPGPGAGLPPPDTASNRCCRPSVRRFL
jgi:hypothetical protein